jgi:hypothetical protein
MDPNTHSISSPHELTALTAAVEGLAAQDLDGLADAVRAERVLGLRRLLDRLEGHWLHGGRTDLANLALLCRAHHRAVHEGAGNSPAPPTAGSPPPHPNRHRPHRRHPTAA